MTPKHDVWFPRWVTIIIIIITIICSLLRVFLTSVSWLFLTGVWMSTSLLNSPWLLSVFWSISKMQYFGWSSTILLFLSPLVLVLILWWLYQEHQLKLVLSSLPCSTAFSFPEQGRGTYPSFHILNVSLWSVGTAKSTVLKFLFLFSFFFFFFVDYYRIWSSGRDLLIRLYLEIPEEFVRLILLDRFWVFLYTICSYGQTSTSCTILSVSPCPPQSCLVWYSFCTNLLHSLIMWLFVSSRSPHVVMLVKERYVEHKKVDRKSYIFK